MDLVIMRQLCDQKQSVEQKDSTIPLSRLMPSSLNVLNESFVKLPQQARIPSFRPLRTTFVDIQALISGKMRRLTAPFLWVIMMGVVDIDPGDNSLLVRSEQRVFNLKSSTNSSTQRHTRMRATSATSNSIYSISASPFPLCSPKMSPQNSMESWGMLKAIWSMSGPSHGVTANKMRDAIRTLNNECPIKIYILSTSVPSSCPCRYTDSKAYNLKCNFQTLIQRRTMLTTTIYHKDGHSVWGAFLNCTQPGRAVPEIVPLQTFPMKSSVSANIIAKSVWKRRKMVCVTVWAPHYNEIYHPVLFPGLNVYDRGVCNDSSAFTHNVVERVGIIEATFLARCPSYFDSCTDTVLVRLLMEVAPAAGDGKVCHSFKQKRLKYCVSPLEFVQVALMQSMSLLRPVMIVVGLH